MQVDSIDIESDDNAADYNWGQSCGGGPSQKDGQADQRGYQQNGEDGDTNIAETAQHFGPYVPTSSVSYVWIQDRLVFVIKRRRKCIWNQSWIDDQKKKRPDKDLAGRLQRRAARFRQGLLGLSKALSLQEIKRHRSDLEILLAVPLPSPRWKSWNNQGSL